MKTKVSLLLAFLISWSIMASEIAYSSDDTLITVGSPDTPFSQNKQNEPWIAVDPSNPLVMAAGANDNIDMEACAAGDPTTCPFTNGVGGTGIYFSSDGGKTWTQPTYTGYSARNCLGPDPCEPDPAGSIGTLPWFYESGLVADGDPSLVFGPRPAPDGSFSWDNGSRLYFSTLTANFSTTRDEMAFKGFEALAVSRVDDVAAAAAGDKDAWMPPVVISKQSSTTFSDKEAIWADNAESSPYFGNVYVCNVAFRSVSGPPEPVVFVRSTDGGETWTQRQISQAANIIWEQGRSGGRQGCVVRSDSLGTVYVVWSGSIKGQNVVWMSRSFDGGDKFDKPRTIAVTGRVGAFDSVQLGLTFDGVAGSRTSEGPSMDIANGAPSGVNAPDTIVVGWTDGQNGLNNERAMLQYSNDGGETWSASFDATEAGDRPDFPWVAISPNGEDVYVTYMGFLDPWRENTTAPRRVQGVVRHADFSDLSMWSTLHRGQVGDARGSSSNSLAVEFLGDYNYVIATNDFAAAVWNDVRAAAVCEDVNAWRASLAGIESAVVQTPAPGTDCPATFGNSEIFGLVVVDPTP